MTSFNASVSTTAISSAQDNDQPHASSSRLQSPTNATAKISSRSPVIGRTPKGKERAVAFDLEPESVGVKGVSEVNNRNVEEREDREDSDTEDEDEDENETEENYEDERQRRIRENQLILARLGFESSGSNLNIGGSASNNRNGKSPPPAGSSSTRKRRNAADIPILDRSGYIISLPPEGQTHTMACIEIPSDRKLKKRISDGEYTDCSYWQKGESRRWKYGFGKGGDSLPEGEEEEVGGVTKDFRWRRWKGLHRELRSEMKKRGELVEMDARPVEQVIPPEGVSAYSLIPGETCHQCRRKSDKPKMKCRNVNPICRASFCETCCKRYSYFDFDEESRSFICPLCKDCCNCSNCIRKKNLAHLLGSQRGAFGKKSIKAVMDAEGETEMTVQSWLEKAVHDISRAPFDLIRIVDQDKDIISPDIPEPLPPIPEEEVGETIVVKKPRKMRAKKTKSMEVLELNTELPKDEGEIEKSKAKRGRKKKVVVEEEGEVPGQVQPEKVVREKKQKKNNGNLVIRLKIPKPTEIGPKPVSKERVKEVDSDGDTVGDWSDDEARNANTDSPLTSISSIPSESPIILPRLPFPPRPTYAPIMNTNEYLSTLPGAMQYSDDSQPNTVPTSILETPAVVSPIKRNTPLRATPPMSNGEYYDSTHESGEDRPPTKKRKRPPPKANIVRAPRHNSLSTSQSQSSPPGIHDEDQYNLPPILSIDHSGSRNMTNSQDTQVSAVPQFSVPSSAQYQDMGIGPPPLLAFPPSSHDIDGTVDRTTRYWQSRPMMEDNPRYQGYQTLLASSSTSSITPTTYPSLTIPDYSNAYSHVNPSFQPSSMDPNAFNTSTSNFYVGYRGGPPPYSHSPIRRPLVLSPNTERQYLAIERSPQASQSSISQPPTKERNTASTALNHLDVLSLAAAEVRQSPREAQDNDYEEGD